MHARTDTHTRARRHALTSTHIHTHSHTHTQIKLEYKDEYGRELTQKEAFRQMSYKFHGQKPGAKKQKKMVKQLELERKTSSMDTHDTPLSSVASLKRQQQKTSSHFVVLSGSGHMQKSIDEAQAEASRKRRKKK